MSRENLLFAIIGILLGFIVGFMFASSMSQKMAMPQTASTQQMPADHPAVGREGGTDPQAVREQVSASLEKARTEPKNFEAQIEAARLYYQIQRFDQAIEFLVKANQIRPTDYETVRMLGVMNLDAGHYDTAVKWYQTAMQMKSDDVMVLAGLSHATLLKGDAKAAEDAIAKLEKVDPNAQDLPGFRDRLASLKAGK